MREEPEKLDLAEPKPDPVKPPIPEPNDLNIDSLYMFDYDPNSLKAADKDKPKDVFDFKTAAEKAASNTEEGKLEMLFSRCEALYAHGFVKHSCVFAQQLANYFLKNPNFGLFNK